MGKHGELLMLWRNEYGELIRDNSDMLVRCGECPCNPCAGMPDVIVLVSFNYHMQFWSNNDCTGTITLQTQFRLKNGPVELVRSNCVWSNTEVNLEVSTDGGATWHSDSDNPITFVVWYDPDINESIMEQSPYKLEPGGILDNSKSGEPIGIWSANLPCESGQYVEWDAEIE